MENLHGNLSIMKKYKLQPQQFLVESNILIDGESEIVKILALNSNVVVQHPIEVLNGECLVSGKLITNVVYLNENNEVNNQYCVTPCMLKLVDANMDNACKLNVCAKVVNGEVSNILNNQIKVITTVDVDATLLKNNQVEYLKSGGEETYLKQQEINVVSFNGQICEKFEENIQISVKNGVKKVLSVNADCIINEVSCGIDFVSFQCDMFAKVLYVDNQETPELQTVTLSKTFKQEVEAKGVDKESLIDLLCMILHDEVSVEIAEKEDGTEIDVSVPFMMCCNKYLKNSVLSAVDAYSTKNVLAIQSNVLLNDNYMVPEYIDGKIEGSIVLGDNDLRIDKYLSTINVSALISNSYVNNKKIIVEGIAVATVIYLNDEQEKVQSVQIEIPFVIDKSCELQNQTMLETHVCVYDVDVMIKRGREIYFEAKVKAHVNIAEEKKYKVVSSAESIGLIPEKEGAIEIYFAKAGETFWEIAKSC